MIANNDKHKLLYKFLVRFLAPLSIKIFVKKINNLKNMGYDKPFIVASNHSSFLDPLIIASIFAVNFNKKIYYIGKEELFKSLPSKIIHEAVGTIPLYSKDKGKTTLITAKKYLQNGKIIGIFPEGRRSPDEKLLKGKTGVARLALSTKVPVLPIAITGTFELMPIGRAIPKFKRKVIINIGKFIYFDKYYDKKTNKKILRKITNLIMYKIQRLVNLNEVDL